MLSYEHSEEPGFDPPDRHAHGVVEQQFILGKLEITTKRGASESLGEYKKVNDASLAA